MLRTELWPRGFKSKHGLPKLHGISKSSRSKYVDLSERRRCRSSLLSLAIIERRCCWWACGASNTVSTHNGVPTYFCSSDRCNGVGAENALGGPSEILCSKVKMFFFITLQPRRRPRRSQRPIRRVHAVWIARMVGHQKQKMGVFAIAMKIPRAESVNKVIGGSLVDQESIFYFSWLYRDRCRQWALQCGKSTSL